MSRVTFKFDERSLMPLDRVPSTPFPVMADTAPRAKGSTRIVVRDPATGEEREMWIPAMPPKCPHCGR